jgi:hypothetical protein
VCTGGSDNKARTTRKFIYIHHGRLGKCHGFEVQASVSAQSIAMNVAMTTSGWSSIKLRMLAEKIDVVVVLFNMGLHPDRNTQIFPRVGEDVRLKKLILESDSQPRREN